MTRKMIALALVLGFSSVAWGERYIGVEVAVNGIMLFI